jgi:pimeloyl-ACP methyl ester carboxylesterase
MYFRVIIHGFWNSHNSRINKAMKEVYMNDYDINLIIVSYGRVSRDTCYKIARSRVKLLGKKIAEFLDSVLGDDEWQWRNLVLVGHSLGCHTAGGDLLKHYKTY